MTGAFYNTFSRHAHGEGLKGRSTHYCPGCGHGLAHKYLSDAIEELGIQNRTVLISPVGCSVFLYYYVDVGNTQAAHGRAPAVAIGHKLANPNAIVVSYQGDGDLASIGLAEIIHAAQLGMPMSVIFVNNATYGMTGGQMAPTTVMDQKTTTSPEGRTRMMGEPLRTAEMIAQISGSTYVERVALFNNKERVRAQKAILKALRLQMENKGFAFVEVLSECPTHLHMTPEEAEKWVQEKMLPIFPLGVKKDEEGSQWFQMKAPDYDPRKVVKVLSATPENVRRHAAGFPSHIAENDIGIKFAGAGGDGAQTAAMLLTHTALDEGFDATHIPSYGPESRGGTSYADVHIAREEVLSPAVPNPHILVAFNSPSLHKFGPNVVPGGIIFYDSKVVSTLPSVQNDVKLYGVPFTDLATEAGKVVMKSIVALGALQEVTQMLPSESFLDMLERSLREKPEWLSFNKAAFEAGKNYIKGVRHVS